MLQAHGVLRTSTGSRPSSKSAFLKLKAWLCLRFAWSLYELTISTSTTEETSLARVQFILRVHQGNREMRMERSWHTSYEIHYVKRCTARWMKMKHMEGYGTAFRTLSSVQYSDTAGFDAHDDDYEM